MYFNRILVFSWKLGWGRGWCVGRMGAQDDVYGVTWQGYECLWVNRVVHMCRQTNGQVYEYEIHVHVRMQQMNIVCVCSMCKIGTDTTEAHKTHNLMLAWPKPNKRRNSSNKNTQNAATQAKLVPLNNRAKYASKMQVKKNSVHTAKTFGKTQTRQNEFIWHLLLKP